MKKMLMSVIALVCLCVLASCGSSPSASQTNEPTATTAPSTTATAQPTLSATQPNAPLVPFKITAVDMSVSPASIAGMICGTQVTVTYTATFHASQDSSGGTVQFGYTVNNGRGQKNASLVFAAGQTTRAFVFTWSGALPIDHTYPEPGGVAVSSPNAINSPLLGPSGTCS